MNKQTNKNLKNFEKPQGGLLFEETIKTNATLLNIYSINLYVHAHTQTHIYIYTHHVDYVDLKLNLELQVLLPFSKCWDYRRCCQCKMILLFLFIFLRQGLTYLKLILSLTVQRNITLYSISHTHLIPLASFLFAFYLLNIVCVGVCMPS